jgi:hypothetical protein
MSDWALYMDGMNESFYLLFNGSLTDAVALSMTTSLGYFFYFFFFGIPSVMMWLKTEDISMTTLFLVWTIGLYGYLMPGTFASEYMSTFVVFGFGIIVYRAFSIFK